MDKAKAIERIQKMLRRTEENGATRNEAEAATLEVQRLLSKFNLSMAEVTKTTDDMIEKATEFKNDDRVSVHVSAIVQEFFFVRTIFRGPLVYLFGEPHNVEIAHHVFALLHREFSRLCASEMMEILLAFDGAAMMLAQMGQEESLIDKRLEPYCKGLVMGAASRLFAERKQFTPGEQNALVAMGADLDKALHERFPDMQETYTTMDVDKRDPALYRGASHGRKIEIRDGITGQAGRSETQAIGEGGPK